MPSGRLIKPSGSAACGAVPPFPELVSMDANMDAKHPDVPIINRYINNGRKYRENKTDIDDIVDKFENDIWTEYDNYAAEKTSGSDQNTEKNNNQGEE